MTDIAHVHEELKARGIGWIGEVVFDANSPSRGFVTVHVSRDARGHQTPSNALLKLAKDNLEANGISIEFLLQQGGQDEVEVGLRATLLHSHIEHIRNAFVSFNKNLVTVWIEPKRPLENEIIRQLEERSKAFLSLLDFQLEALAITADHSLPSTYALLTSIRQLAPAEFDQILSDAVGRGFSIPSQDWLSRKLDVMRKEGRIVRLRNAKYALTKFSLHQLGTTKGRDSPDIRRLLELARQGG